MARGTVGFGIFGLVAVLFGVLIFVPYLSRFGNESFTTMTPELRARLDAILAANPTQTRRQPARARAVAVPA